MPISADVDSMVSLVVLTARLLVSMTLDVDNLTEYHPNAGLLNALIHVFSGVAAKESAWWIHALIKNRLPLVDTNQPDMEVLLFIDL